MSKNTRNIIISIILITISIIFTFLVKVIDVNEIGTANISIGFATINEFVFNKIGVNMLWYHITDWLGIIPILIAGVYAIKGFAQMIKRKSILKVNKEIIALGIFYIVVITLYIFFEKYIVNYRPILMNGLKEASYPSSHTLITICLCGSSIIINKMFYSNKMTKCMDIFSFIIICITVLGRLISGVHWFTDIIGGIIISSALLMTLYSCFYNINMKKQYQTLQK